MEEIDKNIPISEKGRVEEVKTPARKGPKVEEEKLPAQEVIIRRQ